MAVPERGPEGAVGSEGMQAQTPERGLFRIKQRGQKSVRQRQQEMAASENYALTAAQQYAIMPREGDGLTDTQKPHQMLRGVLERVHVFSVRHRALQHSRPDLVRVLADLEVCDDVLREGTRWGSTW